MSRMILWKRTASAAAPWNTAGTRRAATVGALPLFTTTATEVSSTGGGRRCFVAIAMGGKIRSPFLSSLSIRSYASTSTSLQSSTKQYPPYTLFPMPALSPTMDTGSISSWSKAEGDAFSAGDVLCTIETDKAAVDFEAQDDGILAKILRQGPNAVDMAVGTPICVVVDDPKDVTAFADFVINDNKAGSPPATTPASSSDSSQPAAPAAATSQPNESAGTKSILFPSARHLAESNGLDATGIKGSGKGGRVTKGDVMAAMKAGTLPALSSSTKQAATPPKLEKTAASTDKVKETPQAAPAKQAAPASPPPRTLADLIMAVEPSGSYEDVSNSKMRKIIAKRLTESKSQVPHFYTSTQIELDRIMELRKKLIDRHNVKVSVNDFILRCCALALRDVPEVNGTYQSSNNTVRYNDSIDVSVAVATPTGLITPIVFGIDRMGLSEITSTVQDLATRARQGKLAPHEYQGGTFSVSNLGMFGISQFSAVINPPQAAILAVGGGIRSVVATPYRENDTATKKGHSSPPPPAIRTLMTARLSADRRVVDEPVAALFVSALRQYMNEPDLLLL